MADVSIAEGYFSRHVEKIESIQGRSLKNKQHRITPGKGDRKGEASNLQNMCEGRKISLKNSLSLGWSQLWGSSQSCAFFESL